MNKLRSLHLEVLEIIIPDACQMSLNVLNLRSFMILYVGSFFVIPHRDFISFSRVILFNGDGGLQLQESGLRELLPWTEYLLIDRVKGLPNGVSDLNIHGFLHLKDLHLRMCSGVKCILDFRKLSMFRRDVFPELEIVTLTSLYGLTSICHWMPHHSFFPKLRELRLRDLSQLRPYVLPSQLASKLRVLEVSKCKSLLFIFLTSEISVTDPADESSLELPYMEKLELKGLTSLVAFREWSGPSTTRVLFNEKIKLPSLMEMHLMGLYQIESLWDFLGSKECAAGRSPCFANLKYVTVDNCNKLESLFPSEIVSSLLQLEKLEVGSCDQMREVITSGEDDTNPTTMITFPKLQILTLKYLSRLQCFYRGRHLLKFPMLRELDLADLSQMKVFTLPNTQLLQTEGTVLFDEEADFPSLEHLRVSSMRIELLKGNGDTAMFPNLSRLTLEGLQNLKSLPNINSKTLSDVSHVIDLTDVDAQRPSSSLGNATLVPSARVVTLLQAIEGKAIASTERPTPVPLASPSPSPKTSLVAFAAQRPRAKALTQPSQPSARRLSPNEDHKAISLATDNFHRASELGWPSNRVLITIEAPSLEPLVPIEPDGLTLISGPDKAHRSATTSIMGTSIVKAKFHRASRLFCEPFESLSTLEEASLEQVVPNWPVPMTLPLAHTSARRLAPNLVLGTFLEGGDFARAPRPVCEPYNLSKPSNVSWLKMLGSIVPDALTSSSASSSLTQSTWQGHSSQLVRAFSIGHPYFFRGLDDLDVQARPSPRIAPASGGKGHTSQQLSVQLSAFLLLATQTLRCHISQSTRAFSLIHPYFCLDLADLEDLLRSQSKISKTWSSFTSVAQLLFCRVFGGSFNAQAVLFKWASLKASTQPRIIKCSF